MQREVTTLYICKNCTHRSTKRVYENVSTGFSAETRRADCTERQDGIRICTKCGDAAVTKRPEEIVSLPQDALYVWDDMKIVRRRI